MAQVRKANAEWKGALRDGAGTLRLPAADYDGRYSFNSRFGDGQGGTNPEELLGGAHAACFSMALANGLAQAGHPATSVRTEAQVHLDQVGGGPGITQIHLVTEIAVDGPTDDEVYRIAEATKQACPISKALAATKITLEAKRV